jgi:hypothetical protein
MLIQQICGDEQVDFFVIELYGLYNEGRPPTLDMVYLDKEISQIRVQDEESSELRCYYENEKGDTADAHYTHLDKSLDLTRTPLYRKGTHENITRTMNTGIFKITPNNKESSRGLMFIHIRTTQGNYYLCDFPGSEVISEHADLNEEEGLKKSSSKTASKAASKADPASKAKDILLRESKFFQFSLLPFFQKVFLKKKKEN